MRVCLDNWGKKTGENWQEAQLFGRKEQQGGTQRSGASKASPCSLPGIWKLNQHRFDLILGSKSFNGMDGEEKRSLLWPLARAIRLGLKCYVDG